MMHGAIQESLTNCLKWRTDLFIIRTLRLLHYSLFFVVPAKTSDIKSYGRRALFMSVLVIHSLVTISYHLVSSSFISLRFPNPKHRAWLKPRFPFQDQRPIRPSVTLALFKHSSIIKKLIISHHPVILSSCPLPYCQSPHNHNMITPSPF